jgi:hypothetical protein
LYLGSRREGQGAPRFLLSIIDEVRFVDDSDHVLLGPVELPGMLYDTLVYDIIVGLYNWMMGHKF